MHPQRVILFFNVACGDQINDWITADATVPISKTDFLDRVIAEAEKLIRKPSGGILQTR
jgi:hypothetical protein